MTLPPVLAGLRLPVIAAPMFLGSGPDLVVECCRAGIVGAFPALNQRTTAGFGEWLADIGGRLAQAGRGGAPPCAPFAVNLIVHASNDRLDADLDVCIERRVPIVITSMGAVSTLVERVHGYGGLVLHDVASLRHAHKAAEAGVDGVIALTAGAGGHGGTLNPFALLGEIRHFFDGIVVLAGGMSTGRDVAAAITMGADLAYLGTRFLATRESLADAAYKAMIVDSRADDIVFRPAADGVPANYFRQSLLAAGIDADGPDVPQRAGKAGAAPWRDIWSAGHGVGNIRDVPTVAELVDRLEREYRAVGCGS